MPKNKKASGEKVGILGFGEVGQAIAKFYNNPKVKDLNRDDGLTGIDVLHICIPYNTNFESVVLEQIKNSKPKVAIIHSSAAPGTTKKINSMLPAKLRMVVDSPVRGVHPNLYEGLKTFVKFVGADSLPAGKLAEAHLISIGMKVRVVYPSVTTELAKLFDTTYYGICIAWHGEMAKITKQFGVEFDHAVTAFNKTYNEGYIKLGKKNVVRPVLSAPDGAIGGHCVIPNAMMLKHYFESPALDLVLQYRDIEITAENAKQYATGHLIDAEFLNNNA